jgi:uncharacterized protein YbjT (DUF2867 family)
MKRSDLTILVTGATGHQGGAAAHHLLNDGWKVRALVRDPAKTASRALAKAGAELFVGDLLDRASVDLAVADCHGVYSVQSPAGVGEEGELLEAFNLAEAAYDAGTEHFVYSSVRGVDMADGPAYLAVKRRIEEHIAELGLPATIWRPVTFMENWVYQKESILAGHLKAPIAPDVVRQQIAVDDIGKFVALAFAEHDRFAGVTAEIASDEMTTPEVAQLFSLVLDIPVVYDEIEPAPGMVAVRNPAPGEPVPRRADLDALREMAPDLWTIERWIRAQDWKP